MNKSPNTENIYTVSVDTNMNAMKKLPLPIKSAELFTVVLLCTV